MSQVCTRCDGTGFLNAHQIPDGIVAKSLSPGSKKWTDVILKWIETNNDHDVLVCDCCGNGKEWHGEPGQHYEHGDSPGEFGPYAYNGGLCECH